MLCLQQTFIIIYDRLWGICLSVGFVLVLPSFFPLGYFRSSESSVAEQVFFQMVHKLQSHFSVSAVLMLILIGSWDQAVSILLMQYCMSCCNEVRQRGKISAVKFPYWSFRKNGALRNRLWLPRDMKSSVCLVQNWQIRQTIRKLAKEIFCKLQRSAQICFYLKICVYRNFEQGH